MSNFVHLHGHSEYSLLDGLSKIKKMVKAVKEMGMDSLAITDHGAMYGAIEFYKSCLAEGIKPIIGCELYVAKRSHRDKEGKVDSEPYHLTVLAKNFKGYQNLMKLVSIGYLDGYYYRPRVDKELLKEYHEGLIVLSGCGAGQFVRSLKEGDYQEGEETAKEYLSIFGEGNYYFELQNHEYGRYLKAANLDPAIRRDLEQLELSQKILFEAVKKLSPKLGIPVVATNDFHYVSPDDAPAQDALVCVQTGKFISDINRLRMIDVPNFYIRAPEEMDSLFTDFPEATKNTVKLAELVNLELKLGKPIFPIFDLPEKKTAVDYLRELCSRSLAEKYPDQVVYKTRMEYELSVIEAKNFSTYFLIFHDFVHWAHQQRIITNTRGSAAGSLVLYLLGITNLDPISFNLPFERFMNPLRPKLPDIDCDIADDKRDEVIRYIMDRYGHDKVAHITTFGTMMGRAAIRDIGRVLGMSYASVDTIAKLVPPPKQGFHKTLDDALAEVPELKDIYTKNLEVKRLIDLAKKVEGSVRHASVHAAGVVIAPEPLSNYTPLQREANGDKIVTQYDMFSVTEDYEGVGLIKMDLLGIRNLSILGHSVDIVKQNRDIEIVLSSLPLDDKTTFKLLGRGDTMGLFQLEGSGMTRYLTELKPTNFSDIMAMIALYRPGPIASIPDYISRKHNPAKIKYFDERMKEYMQQSLGLLVYQEDVLLTAINIAGYDWLQADKLRKAMGKKIPEEMRKERDHFIEGCIKNGLSHDRADELFKLIEPFAAYGFGKAHAASYAMISYQTAYMKANYPVEFMAAVMTAEYGDSEKIAHAMLECKHLEIVVLPPDVNKSVVGFSIEDVDGALKNTHPQGIRFGLSAIKNVGVSAIESIIKAREKGAFKSISDLCSRVDNRLVNRKTLDSLIKSGAMDGFATRSAQLMVLDQCLNEAHKRSKDVLAGQTSLFADSTEEATTINIKLPEIEELPLSELLSFEKDLLGFYLHEPPYLGLLKLLGDYTTVSIAGLSEEYIGKQLTLGGVVTEVKKVMTKKTSSEMAFLTLSDGISSIEVVVFPKVYERSLDCLQQDKVVILTGKIDKREDKLSVLVDTVVEFEANNLNLSQKTIEITVPSPGGAELLKRINQTLRSYPGQARVSILLPSGGSNLNRMELPFGVSSNPDVFASIEVILGKGTVRLT
ncbi:DNA polymerase III subunit alpha [Candidatus Daviesbacteria bacterium RIFCSPHIGHO2_02_FULL_41_14]|uniref:DNA polymerase III subunit alpha n=1 Tax=Candidatus Daviesbacteria bacterium RIFCSPLOWO2_01_FULL_40_24 TaxID=1797787 RepID=A0A1F5MJ19_9BACT|nr:MAG: DNA polymerase III subunit alpha [Candidatus Daviesbacteria bacterium RIFCSPHIGHO2_01_FULL_41_45]OGE34452.1 MAG: DNA polymerase III subunit alpha [Candidatus Daviesbacteria bacterium RIFCSPHIGHO2_02_FULL_41_14]OGE65364.1 MAG: DNA polymerase III subunit alpha [Candidatus Daviesbacteria bacterium RIFCSPLOWO2_01_FULL_40_24]